MSNFSCSLTRNITPHSMKNLAVHSLLSWQLNILPILTTSLIFSFEGLGECTFRTWEWKGKMIGFPHWARAQGLLSASLPLRKGGALGTRSNTMGGAPLLMGRVLPVANFRFDRPEVSALTWLELVLSLPRVINFKFPLQPHQKY